MIRHHIHLLVLLTAIAIAPGCSTPVGKYFHNRALDTLDCAGFQAGNGMAVPVCIGVEVTPFVPIGVGLFCNPEGYGNTYGFAGRNVGIFRLATNDFPYQLFLFDPENRKAHNRSAHIKFYDGGTDYYNYSVQGWNDRRYGRFGVHFGILCFYVAADIEALEIADFFTGIFGYDLTGDDGSPIAYQNGDLVEFRKTHEQSKQGK